MIRRTVRGNRLRAERLEREIISSVEAGTWGKEEPKVRALTLGEFEAQFLDHAELHNKPSTVKAKRDILRVHLRPFFGDTPLDGINVARIAAFKVARKRQGLSAKSINNALSVLRKLLTVAKDLEALQSIPSFEWMPRVTPEFDFLTFEEAERLLEAAEPGQWRTLVLIALNTGLRLGELTGLQWDCVDLRAQRIRVKWALYRGVLGTPKSHRSRDIPMNDLLVDALKAHRHLRGPYVFCNEDGSFLNAYNACGNAIARFCRKTGLRHVSWHVLRHTFASHLVMRGVSLKAVQELLGHSTIEMTMRYAHLAPHIARDAVMALQQSATAHKQHMEATN